MLLWGRSSGGRLNPNNITQRRAHLNVSTRIAASSSYATSSKHFKIPDLDEISPLESRFDPERIERTMKTLDITWGDQHTSMFPFIWLRDNCLCPQCVDPHSGQKKHSSAEINPKIGPAEITRNGDGDLKIVWNLGKHQSTWPMKWLREHCLNQSEIARRNLVRKKGMELWEFDLENFPTFDHNAIMNDDQELFNWMVALRKWGVSVVKNVPKKKSGIEEVTSRIGPQRSTMYGSFFDVKNVPEAINVAYTNTYLDLHQDLMYYELPPGYQFLHCIKASKEGGENFIMDGFRVMADIQHADQDAFALLSQYPCTYHKNGSDHSLIYKRPIFEIEPDGYPVAMNFAPPFSGPLEIPTKHVESYYAALRTLDRMMQDPSRRITFKLEPGDMFAFDNRRVLHGRTEFDPNAARHLRGTYIDRDEFLSKFRVLEKAREKPANKKRLTLQDQGAQLR
eukprot:TRINITY_DN9617_c0_g1_i1.p1 TRINITY_DN9617_c0_g1~~TRINITY_DN9617_c0_g1_i1.p1  ORF type:complete len:452 (-),score=79.19 TRINITY_DN9617_c0_g1_i1:430-1785(-)